MLEEQYEQDIAASSVGGVINDFLHGRRVAPEVFLGALGDLLGAAGVGGARRAHVPGGAGHRVSRDWDVPPGQRRVPRPPPPPQIDFELQRELLGARQELGFEPRAPLTVALVEQRRKDLARRHHPDLGGPHEQEHRTQRMGRINAAADLLVAQPDLG